MRKTAIHGLFLIIASIVVCLASIEILGWLGAVNYRALLSPPNGNIFEGSDRADPELTHLHVPNAHVTGSVVGGDITGAYEIPRSDMSVVKFDLHYDRNGFRNRTDLSSADMVVLGDSFVESVVTPDADLLNSRLAELRGEQVANLGQYDYGPVEELAVLRRYGLPLRPRTVVWMFFEGNDLTDVARHQMGGYRNRPPEIPKPAPQRLFLRNTMSQLRERSFLQNATAQLRWRARLASRPSGRKRAGTVMSNGQARTVYFRYPAQPYSRADLLALDETTRILTEAETLCANAGSHFLFVFIPTKFRAVHESCSFSQESECRNWTLNDLPERLRKAVGPPSSSVGYLNLTPYYADAAKNGILAYFPDDDHWSSEGERVAAEAIIKYVTSTWEPQKPI